MSATHALVDDQIQMPRRTRHLYLVAVDGCIVDQAIEYGYDFNRLVSITHPLYPDENVTYTYGTDADRALNQAGRVKRVTHQSGSEDIQYGSMGETVQETLTLTAAANGGSTPPVYTTRYDWDSFGRLRALTLPDSEVITNRYDSGGNLNEVDGTLNGRPYQYMKELDYDKFGQRIFLKVGNGVETKYTYDPNNRRLANLKSGSPGKAAMQDIAYHYDNVGNISSLIDTAPIPKANIYGGQSTQHFHYDDLYRLVKADGDYTTAREVQHYDLAMAYDAIHNITHKNQLDTVSKIGGTPRTERATTYNWGYTYQDNHHPQPHAPTHIGNRSFDYDADGNQIGWQSDDNGSRRVIVWDEDNRIREVQDPKHGAAFSYDDKGERKLRKSQYGEVAYINQYFTVRNGAIASTNVYAGTSRIATKVGAGTPVGKVSNIKGTGNLSPNSPTGGSIVVTGVSSNTTIATTAGNTGTTATTSTTTTTPSPRRGEGGGEGGAFPGQGLAHRSDRANEVARNTEKNKHLNGGTPGGVHGAANSNAGGNGPSTGSGQAGTSNNPGANTGGIGGSTGGNTHGGAGHGSGREFIYFYHPDHLGSTGYVTDEKAKRYEHITYFPFGETWVQEANATWRVPYQFTSKELDQETGLYYFGARYYDPRTSVWQSADPVLSKYFGGKLGMGGIYNSRNLGMYSYAHFNPLSYTDPDGNFTNPVENVVLRSHVSGRHNPMASSYGMVRNNGARAHQGLDLRATSGTQTYAVGNGRIVAIDRAGNHDYGKNITYKFTYNYSVSNFLYDLFSGNWGGMGDKISNSGKTFYARHAHLNTISSNLRVGSQIKEGQDLGTTGSTGNAASLPKSERHLHFEIRDRNPVQHGLDGRVNPARFLQGLNSNPKDNRSSNQDEWE